MILGLTGSMGGGKSTAARFFAEAGFRRIDSDQIVRDHLLTSTGVIDAVARRFPGVVGPGGQIERATLARHVFENEADRVWLEELLHPQVYAQWRKMLATDPVAHWVIEVPLLFEKGLENWFDFTVCVATSSPNQFARLLERGIPHALAAQRISKQLPLAQKQERADFVLSNDGTPESLHRQVNHLAAMLSGVR